MMRNAMKIKNFQIKLLAVIITLILYLFVNSQGNRAEITLIVPVEFKNLPADKFILLPTKRSAEVSLRGPSHQINAVKTSNLSFEVTLPEVIGDQLTVNLNNDQLDLPSSVKAFYIAPSKLDLVIDDIVSKIVPIEIPMLGEMISNYKLIGLSAQPKTVELSGPQTEVGEIANIQTLPLDIRGIKKSGSQTVQLRNPGSYTTLEPSSVEVAFDIANLAIEKTFKNIAVNIKSKGSDALVVNPREVTIRLSALRSEMKKISVESLKPYVEISSKPEANQKVKVMLDLPEPVSVIGIQPAEVIVALDEVNSK